MTILFDATRPVKPASFAAGLYPARKPRTVGHTAADEAWWAVHSPANQSGYEVVSEPTDAEFERMAIEAAIRDRYESGTRWH